VNKSLQEPNIIFTKALCLQQIYSLLAINVNVPTLAEKQVICTTSWYLLVDFLKQKEFYSLKVLLNGEL